MAFKKGFTPWNKGIKTGIKTKGTTGMKFAYNKDRAYKISKANKGKPKSDIHKKKLSEYAKKRRWSDEHKKRISDTLKEKYRKNPELTKKLANHKENHPNWKGGISYEPYSVDWTNTLKRAIRERDHYTCRVCIIQLDILYVHHIDYNKKNCDPKNLVALCNSCHTKTNFNRIYWMRYFWNLLKSNKK